MLYYRALFSAPFVVALAGATPVAAQSFLNTAETIAADHPRIQSAEDLARAGRSDAAAARAALRPQLGLTAEAGWDSGDSSGRSGSYVLPEITASQLLFDGGRTAADTVIRTGSGDFLAVMLNTDAQQITQAAFSA